ncbi:MAG: carboxypeptidase-like regulatory domain-containing protein [Bacteroidales bacterium]|nr:carboxypeptidase-like regulatory domain-containing protein [Bacteroidales bacterium]
MKIRFIFLILILISGQLFSQDSTIYVISGKVIDAETLKPVPLVFMLNTTKMHGANTDTSGKYRILMMKNDSIRISCIGYYTEYWQPDFSEANAQNKINTPIYIVPQTYPLGKIDIYQVRWESFVYDMSNLELQEDETQIRLIKWISRIVENEDLASINVKSGIQIPLPIYTSREKQLKKIKQQQRIDELNRQAEEKFNKQLVSNITKLEGPELDEFMKYCSFDRNFIIQSSEYELIVIIQDIFEEYKLNPKKDK